MGLGVCGGPKKKKTLSFRVVASSLTLPPTMAVLCGYEFALVCEVPRSERSVCRVPVAGFPISGSSMLIGGLLLGLLSRPFPGKNLPFLSRPPWRRYNLIRE